MPTKIIMTDSEKVVSLETLEKITISLKNEGKNVVLCHGTFDLLHVGHIKHLQAAKKLGDILLVTITADKYVNKGPDRPVFSEHLRADNLSALSCIDYVAINFADTSVNVLQSLQPTTYVKGDEFKKENSDITGFIDQERLCVESYGGRIKFTEEVTFSSSTLLNEYFEVFPPKTKAFIDDFKKEFKVEEIFQQIDALKTLNVAILGDGIIDEYHYVDELGQIGKGNFPAVRYKSEERFAGGAFAVANHVAGFASRVTLVTAIGDNDEDEKFIKGKLKENIKSILFHYNTPQTLTKRRYVDAEVNKYFEVYYSETEPMDDDLENTIIAWIKKHFQEFDAVIVPDFGNGLITSKIAQVTSEFSSFLAVNTQINSGNRGYHVITRYPKADFISLNEPEIRMAAHDKNSELKEVIAHISGKLSARFTAVTRGTNGATLLDRKERSTFEVPAISTKVIDRIGAGDAFLSLSALCLANNTNIKLAAFIASIAAALDVQIVCNRNPIDIISVKTYIKTLFK